MSWSQLLITVIYLCFKNTIISLLYSHFILTLVIVWSWDLADISLVTDCAKLITPGADTFMDTILLNCAATVCIVDLLLCLSKERRCFRPTLALYEKRVKTQGLLAKKSNLAPILARLNVTSSRKAIKHSRAHIPGRLLYHSYYYNKEKMTVS